MSQNKITYYIACFSVFYNKSLAARSLDKQLVAETTFQSLSSAILEPKTSNFWQSSGLAKGSRKLAHIFSKVCQILALGRRAEEKGA